MIAATASGTGISIVLNGFNGVFDYLIRGYQMSFPEKS